MKIPMKKIPKYKLPKDVKKLLEIKILGPTPIIKDHDPIYFYDDDVDRLFIGQLFINKLANKIFILGMDNNKKLIWQNYYE